MAIKRKSTHVCAMADKIKEQSNAVAQINLWLAGNHDPENGMIYKMIDTVNDVKAIKSDIKDINTKISLAIEGAKMASSALEKYKAETQQFEAGKTAVVTRRDLMLSRLLQAGGLVIAIYMAYLGYRKLAESNIVTDKKIENLGSPVIVNPRGELVPLPEGYNLKMWGKDLNSDTIK